MITILGNKQKELSRLPCTFKNVVADLGTGDGKFIYREALKNPDTLFIGIDPSAKQLSVYSKKAVRKKLRNTLFVLGSIETLPKELTGCINKLYIILPWGSLLEKVVNPTEESIKTLAGLLKSNGEIEIIFGYDPKLELSETKRLNLPEISADYINKQIAPIFEKIGPCKVSVVNPSEVDTTWGRKLTFGRERKIYKIVCNKRSN